MIPISQLNNSTGSRGNQILENGVAESSRSSSPTSMLSSANDGANEGGVPIPQFRERSASGGSCEYPESYPNSPLPEGFGMIAPVNLISYHMKDNEFGNTFKILRQTDQVKELQTLIRDRNTPRNKFKFSADRLIRLVIEETLDELPFTECDVITPTGATYHGLNFMKGNCGVSIVRSGEAMEQGLRDCCRSIRIGKILVERNSENETRVVYARFPEDISNRKVVLMYPIMSSGNTTVKAVKVLKDHQVQEENILLANLFCTPHAVRSLIQNFPSMKIVTSEVHPIAPNHFGTRYFGTD